MDNVRDNKLHKTLHFRKIREIVLRLCEYEQINIEGYDLFNMRAYECTGSSLKGKNVSYNSEVKQTYSCWVDENNYQVIEIPKKSNKMSFSGDFFVLARNKDYNYWLLVKMKHRIDKGSSIKNKIISEKILFEPIGKYTIFINNKNKVFIRKEALSSECSFGGTEYRNKYFDFFNIRKQAYNIDNETFINNLIEKGTKVNKNGLIDSNKVKIYNKKRRRN